MSPLCKKALASKPLDGIEPEKVTLVRLVQPKKAASPMLVTPLGIVMLVRLVQLSKVEYPMLVMLFGIFTLVRLVQPAKAFSSMLVTLLKLH